MSQEIIFSYHKKIQKVLQEYNLENLEDYTIDSPNGCDLAIFYKEVVEKIIDKSFHVYADEVSDSKYLVVFNFDDGISLTLHSKARYTKEDISDAIMDFIIRPYLRWKDLGEAS